MQFLYSPAAEHCDDDTGATPSLPLNGPTHLKAFKAEDVQERDDLVVAHIRTVIEGEDVK